MNASAGRSDDRPAGVCGQGDTADRVALGSAPRRPDVRKGGRSSAGGNPASTRQGKSRRAYRKHCRTRPGHAWAHRALPRNGGDAIMPTGAGLRGLHGDLLPLECNATRDGHTRYLGPWREPPASGQRHARLGRLAGGWRHEALTSPTDCPRLHLLTTETLGLQTGSTRAGAHMRSGPGLQVRPM